MSALGCYVARTLHREAPMAALSVPQNVLLDAVSGRRVAYIGADCALAETDSEPEIDAANLEICIDICPIPDDHISPRRSDFFMARPVLRDIQNGAPTW